MKNYGLLLNNLRSLSKLYEKYSLTACEKHTLTKAELDVLAFLLNHPEKDTASDVVEMRMLSKANVSQAVESLIKKGLLTRQADKSDRRYLHLICTDKAQRIAKDIHSMQKEFFEVLFLDFEQSEIDTFVNNIAKISQNAINDLKGKAEDGKK